MARFRPSRPRAELLARLTTAGRELSVATLLFHSAVAASRGLTATETKAVDVLDRDGPLTAGELAARLGLSPPSVTALIDRLERKRFVRRHADPRDRRRVRVERTAEGLSSLAPLFADFGSRLAAMYDGYSDDELEIILRFMTDVAVHQQAAAQALMKAGAAADITTPR